MRRTVLPVLIPVVFLALADSDDDVQRRPLSGGDLNGSCISRARPVAAGYDVDAVLAIPNKELARRGVEHTLVSGAQQAGYRAFAKTGATLTWDSVRNIEVNALIRGGMSPATARATVDEVIKALKGSGVAGPTRIPWGGG